VPLNSQTTRGIVSTAAQDDSVTVTVPKTDKSGLSLQGRRANRARSDDAGYSDKGM